MGGEEHLMEVLAREEREEMKQLAWEIPLLTYSVRLKLFSGGVGETARREG